MPRMSDSRQVVAGLANTETTELPLRRESRCAKELREKWIRDNVLSARKFDMPEILHNEEFRQTTGSRRFIIFPARHFAVRNLVVLI